MSERPAEQRFAGTPVPTPPIPDDDGSASGALIERLAEFEAGEIGGEPVLAALAGARLLIPVVAILDEADVAADGQLHEKHSTMATVLVQRRSGGRALLAFSSTDALGRWRADARPVPLAAPLAARAAVDEDAETLLIDVAGPVPFAVSDAELQLVAAVSRLPGEPCEDPVLAAALHRLIAAEDRVASMTLRPGERGGAILALGIRGDDRSWLGQLVQQIAADRVVARLLPEGLLVTPESA